MFIEESKREIRSRECDHLLPMSPSRFLLIITLGFSFHVRAQTPPNSDPPGILKPLHPSLAVIIAVISIMISATLLIIAYAKFCSRHPLDISGQNNNRQTFQGLIRLRSGFSGIDRVVVDSLPFFRFSSLKGSKEGLECAVCISGFEDSEILRLLPKCRHAFHKNCIDQWLESHSTCPLCRYRFDPEDLKSFTYSNSLRFLRNPSNLSQEPNIELFVQRHQENLPGSSRSNVGSSFRNNEQQRKDKLQIPGGSPEDNRKTLHKFKHRIIVSDVVVRNRWSDVNSSDLLSLNSEMLGFVSSQRFSTLSLNENKGKIKEDIERKRLCESKISRFDGSNSVTNSSFFPSTSHNEDSLSRMIDHTSKRSVSEITNFSRFEDPSISNRLKEFVSPRSSGKEERIRRLWLPIVRRTVQWFAVRERSFQESDVV